MTDLLHVALTPTVHRRFVHFRRSFIVQEETKNDCIIICSFICPGKWYDIYKLCGSRHFQSASPCAVANSTVERSNLEENSPVFIEYV